MIQPDIDNVFTYLVDFQQIPGEELVTENDDGSYTILINSRISYERQITAYQHAIGHIVNHDFEKEDVQQIEAVAHKVTQPVVRRIKPAVRDKYRKFEERDKVLRKRLTSDKYWEVVIARLENQRLGADY